VAFAHAHGQPSQPTIYADVALAHSLSQDDLLSSSLHYLYMSPLEDLGDGGAALRETLKAYFSVDRNAVSAASALGISRHTVTKRLRQVEALLNRPLTSCATELEIALLIHEPTGSGP
jgi:DNA-binding PucR family transcriptional regulator